jgi:TP901 family phage tail tape measure protein
MASTQKLQVLINATNNTRKAFKKAQSQMQGLQKKARKVGKSMQRVGSSMTKYVTAPIVGAAGAATKFAADFENNMNQMQAAAGLPEEAMGKIGGAVEDAAVRTGESTGKISEAMTLAQSSTLEVEEANNLVKKAAEGAASGLGEMKTLVNLGTTAANKFDDSVSSATEGMSVMAAAAEDSQTSVDQFADGILKGSAQMDIMNVSMQEGSTVFSRLSDSAANARVAGTQFRAFLGSMQDPSDDMKQAIQGAFGSTKQFRKEMDENAIDALFKLKKQAQEAGTTVAELAGNKRAAAGASNFFASSQEEVNATLEKTMNSQDKLSEMFKESASFSRLLARAFQAVKKAGRALGDVLIQRLSGTLATVVSKISNVADAFENLSPKTQNIIITLGGVVAALGPLIAIMGTLSVLLGSIGATTLLVTGAIGALAAAGVWVVSNWNDVKSTFENVWNTLQQWGVIKLIKKNLELLWKNIRENLIPVLRQFWQNHGEQFKFVAKAIAAVLGGVLYFAIQGIITILNGVVSIISTLIGWWNKLLGFFRNTVGPRIQQFASKIKRFLRDPIKTVTNSVNELISAFSDLINKIQNFLDISGDLPDWAVEGVGGALPDFLDVSGSFDSGGVVPGPIGQPRLAKVHAGETILPTHKKRMAAGGSNINITINGDVSGREVIEKVKRGIKEDLKRETKLSTR